MPRVVHVVRSFLAPSEAWLTDLISVPGAYSPTVVCDVVEGDPRPLLPIVELGASKLPGPVAVLPRRLTRHFLASREVYGERHVAEMQRRLAALNLEAEVVHAHFGQVAWIARSAGMCPLVASFYGSDASSGAVLRRWASRYTELFADRGLVVAEGPAMVERLVALGADRTRTRVLPLMAPVDTVPWHPPSTAGRIEVLMAGRLVAKKGFGLGLAAFAEVSGRHDVALTVMGSGPEDQTLRANAGRLGVLDRVRFIPFADRSAFWAALANADVLLQPSRVAPDGDAEGGAPTVILDAQARGCVLVVSDHADIPFIVDPDAAYLSHESDLRDLINKLEAACRTRDEWTERSARGRAHMEAQHSPTAVAARRDAIYTEALALNRRTGVSRGVG